MINLVPSLLICDAAGEKIQEKVKENILRQLKVSKVPGIFDFLKISEAGSTAITKAFYKVAARRSEVLKSLDCWVNESVEVFFIMLLNRENVSAALAIAKDILDSASRISGGGCSLILLTAKGIFGLSDEEVKNSLKLLEEQLQPAGENYFKKIYFVDEYNEMGLILDSEEEVGDVTATYISACIASEMSLILLDLTRPRFDGHLSQLFTSFSCYHFKFSRSHFLHAIARLLAGDLSKDLFRHADSSDNVSKSEAAEKFAGDIKKSVEDFVGQFSETGQDIIFSEIVSRRELPPALWEELAQSLFRYSAQMDFNLKKLRSFLENCLDNLLVHLENDQKKVKEEKEVFVYRSIAGFLNAFEPPAATQNIRPGSAAAASSNGFDSGINSNDLKNKIHLYNLKKALYFAYFVALDRICLGFDMLFEQEFSDESAASQEKTEISKFDFDLLETAIVENFYALESENLKSGLNLADIINRLIRNLSHFPKIKPRVIMLNYCLEKIKQVEEYPLEQIWKYSLLPMQLSEKLSTLAPLNLSINSNSERFLVINAPRHWCLDENSFEFSYIKKTVDSALMDEATIIQLSLETRI